MPVVWNEKTERWDHQCGYCKTVNPLGWGTSTERNEDGSCVEWCDSCSKGSFASVPDVFWDGRPEENLADGPDGKPRVFLSKGQKAAYLKERGISEVGDKVHGAPYSSVQREDARTRQYRNSHMVAEARRKVQQMGRDVKRQEILRIMKEARRYA